ncbi:MAG TPA: PhoU domain-containing protein, partial [Bacillota bacterium]|nr:PhoU domain-containing protein [Bacillota bacterium]
ISLNSLNNAIGLLGKYDEKIAKSVKDDEQQTDVYEDALGTYLVRLSAQQLSAQDNTESAKLLYLIGEFERIADYALNIEKSAEEMHDKEISFSGNAKKELGVMVDAVREVTDLAVSAFSSNDPSLARRVEPLEEVIDDLKYELKKQHINRLQANACTIELGFIFSDLIMVLERVSDHCSNIAGVVIELSKDRLDLHEYLHRVKHDPNNRFAKLHREYAEKYNLKDIIQES